MILTECNAPLPRAQALQATLDRLVLKAQADGVCPLEAAAPGSCAAGGSGAGAAAPTRGAGSSPRGAFEGEGWWWTHMRSAHLKDAMNVVASIIQQCDQESTATQGPHLRYAAGAERLYGATCV